LPYDITASFVVAGLTSSGVPFGTGQGGLTRLFFLICCKDDRTHLHVLTRLGRMLHDGAHVEALLACGNVEDLRARLEEMEAAAIR